MEQFVRSNSTLTDEKISELILYLEEVGAEAVCDLQYLSPELANPGGALHGIIKAIPLKRLIDQAEKAGQPQLSLNDQQMPPPQHLPPPTLNMTPRRSPRKRTMERGSDDPSPKRLLNNNVMESSKSPSTPTSTRPPSVFDSTYATSPMRSSSGTPTTHRPPSGFDSACASSPSSDRNRKGSADTLPGFSIPVSKFSRKLSEAVRSKKIVVGPLRKEFVRLVTEELIEYTANPSPNVVKTCVGKIFEKVEFRMAFCDRIGTIMVDDVTKQSLVREILDRKYYVARPEVSPSQKRKETPEASVSQCDSDDIQNAKNELLQLYGTSGSRDEENVKVLMDKSMEAILSFIQKEKPSADSLRKEYPFSFETVYFVKLFYMICKVDLLEHIRSFFSQNAKPIVRFGLCSKNQLIRDACAAAIAANGADSLILGSVVHMMLYSKEKPEALFSFQNVFDVNSVVKKEPHIVALGTGGLLRSEKFFVMVDTIVAKKTSSIEAALVHWFACYFVFNIKYPKETEKTCHLFEKVICKIGDGKSKLNRGAYRFFNLVAAQPVEDAPVDHVPVEDAPAVQDLPVEDVLSVPVEDVLEAEQDARSDNVDDK